MNVRSWLGWVLHGRERTVGTLDSLSADLRALQERVDRIEHAVQTAQRAMATDLHEVRDRQLDEFDRVREAVIDNTDDLSTRIAALHARLEDGR